MVILNQKVYIASKNHKSPKNILFEFMRLPRISKGSKKGKKAEEDGDSTVEFSHSVLPHL